MKEDIPYAMFWFNERVVKMTKQQYEQALRDSKHCKCGRCLVCRTREYDDEIRGE